MLDENQYQKEEKEMIRINKNMFIEAQELENNNRILGF